MKIILNKTEFQLPNDFPGIELKFMTKKQKGLQIAANFLFVVAVIVAIFVVSLVTFY